MVKVLFVCLGNICRSPLGEAIFRHKVRERGLEKFFKIASSGTSNYHIGDNADSRSISVAKSMGIAIEHCVSQITEADLDAYDYIVAMDNGNLRNILKLSRDQKHRARVFLMRDYDPEGKGLEVPDPYYGETRHFKEVYDILDRSIEKFLDFLQETELQLKKADA
jgi:protein-tyrosine phosphatase